MSYRGSSVLKRAVHACTRAIRHVRNTTLSSLFLLALPLTAQAVFTTPGSFEVNPDGSAGYTIPIQVPPGTAGMAPKLSLVYNSNGGNGPLGMGWSLEGLSQIGRCPKTVPQDGARGVVKYDANDRFCLDGQRLIGVSGTYGANGSMYRTEQEQFAKIVSYGTAGTGPAWFKAWTKNGQIIEYGNTADSRIEAQGKTTARLWGVNKISDTKGNYLAVTYGEDSVNGEAYVTRIEYTGNAVAVPSVPPYAAVDFLYEGRQDTSSGYEAGSMLRTSLRLKNIKTSDANLVKDYQITYEEAPGTKRSRIKSLKECDGQGVCLGEITFDWIGTVLSAYLPANNLVTGFSRDLGWIDNNIYPRSLIDMNGDGLADVVGFGADGVSVSLNSHSGMSDPTVWSTQFNVTNGWSNNNEYPRSLVDMNLDGLPDVVGFGTDGVYVAINTGTGLNASTRWVAQFDKNVHGWTDNKVNPRSVIDVNGDGKPDIVGFGSDGVYVALNTGSAFSAPTRWVAQFGKTAQGWTDNNNFPRTLVDVNKDGLPDVVGFGTDAVYVALNTGSAFAAATKWVSQFDRNVNGWTDNNTYPRHVVDINGDDLPDIIGFGAGETYAAINNGSQFVFTGVLSNEFTVAAGWSDNTSYPRSIVDVNGDELPDLVGFGPDGVYVGLNKGEGFSPSTKWIAQFDKNLNGWADNNSFPRHILDINGDGIPEIVGFGIDVTYVSSSRINGAEDSIKNVGSAAGPSVAITYQPITDAAVYVKDSGTSAAVSPQQDILQPIYVVSAVNSSDGVGGMIATSYKYGGLKADFTGRGSLGFRWMKSESPDNGISVTTFNRQDYPYVGLPSQIEKRRLGGNVLLGATNNTYACLNPATGLACSVAAGNRYFPYVSQSVENQYELDGSLVTSTTTGFQYDSYGNVTQLTVNSGDGHVKTVTNAYSNNATTWILGRLLRSTVTTTAP